MTSGTRRASGDRRAGGFTLIEVLVVISIIAILAGLVLGGVQLAQKNARIAAAKTEVMGLTMALDNYVGDEGEYPTKPGLAEPGENEFPALYGALFGARRPLGPGGRSAPYTRAEEARTAVQDGGSGEYRCARRDEIRDPGADKYLLDPFGSPYVYRVNKGRRPQPFSVILDGADIYSLGPDEADETLAGAVESDDIGNW